MSALTTSSTITRPDGAKYRVSTLANSSRVEHGGRMIAWFALTPYGWLHRASGRIDKDSVTLALRIVDNKP